jgi:hypothetical protein
MKTALFILLFFLNGCAAVQPLKTPSGKPDITIPKVSKKQVSDKLINMMLTKGFNIKNSSDYNLVFTKPMDKLLESLLLGSQYDVTPENRVSFNIVESSVGIRIVITNQAITNPGSAFERVTDLSTGNAGMDWQNFLLHLKNSFN